SQRDEPRRVGERAEESGIRDDREPARAEAQRGPIPSRVLLEQGPLELRELTVRRVPEVGGGVDAVERLRQRHPLERRGRTRYDGALPCRRGAVDRNDQGSCAHGST